MWAGDRKQGISKCWPNSLLCISENKSWTINKENWFKVYLFRMIQNMTWIVCEGWNYEPFLKAFQRLQMILYCIAQHWRSTATCAAAFLAITNVLLGWQSLVGILLANKFYTKNILLHSLVPYPVRVCKNVNPKFFLTVWAQGRGKCLGFVVVVYNIQ